MTSMLGRLMANAGKNRHEHDFYPTPVAATEALLRSRWFAPPTNAVWEPACGDGAISWVLERNGFVVTSTDLVDRGYGDGVVDFLTTSEPWAPTVITNPPFKLAENFIWHAMKLGVPLLALLLKVQFWNAKTRLDLFEQHPPNVVLPLTWRLDWTGGGAPTMDCAWCVWDRSLSRGAHFEPLAKPDLLAEMLA